MVKQQCRTCNFIFTPRHTVGCPKCGSHACSAYEAPERPVPVPVATWNPLTFLTQLTERFPLNREHGFKGHHHMALVEPGVLGVGVWVPDTVDPTRHRHHWLKLEPEDLLKPEHQVVEECAEVIANALKG